MTRRGRRSPSSRRPASSGPATRAGWTGRSARCCKAIPRTSPHRLWIATTRSGTSSTVTCGWSARAGPGPERTADMRTSHTQVVIVGAGPGGLLLSHLLYLHGIDPVALELRSREHGGRGLRPGVLERAQDDL